MRSSRNLAILICGVFLTLCLIGHSAGRNVPARVEQAENAKASHPDSVILVEAFMVWVPLSELHDLGIPEISEESQFVSAEHILKCLKKPGVAAVTAGAKLAIGQDRQAKTNVTATQGTYSGPPEKRVLDFIDVGTTFEVEARITSWGKILVELDFEHSNLEESDDREDIGPSFKKRRWSNSMSLTPGKATLAGATHGDEAAEFLIVTANIQK